MIQLLSNVRDCDTFPRMLRYQLLPYDERPLPNARTRTSSLEPRRIVPLSCEEARRIRCDRSKKNCPGAVYAPCLDCEWLKSWPFVWRAPIRQDCDVEARQYRFKALVECSSSPGTFTLLLVQYMDARTMPASQKSAVGHVRRACKLLTEVSA